MSEMTQRELAEPLPERVLRDWPIDVVVLRRTRPIDTDVQIMDVLRGLGYDARFVGRHELEPSPDRLLWLRGTATWYRQPLADLRWFSGTPKPCGFRERPGCGSRVRRRVIWCA